ncbi:MAG: hypothetical protein ACHREM_04695 [Polyangiales bacterium]
MGADGSAYVVIGFEVKRSQFFEKVSTSRECPKGHKAPAEAGKFCSQCGGAFSDKPIERPTEAFVKFAKETKRTATPEQAWYELANGEGIALKEPGRSLGVFDVGALESSEDESKHQALGFKLLNAYGEGSRGDPPTRDLSAADVARYFEMAQEMANDLGIKDAKVRLFLTYYWSC